MDYYGNLNVWAELVMVVGYIRIKLSRIYVNRRKNKKMWVLAQVKRKSFFDNKMYVSHTLECVWDVICVNVKYLVLERNKMSLGVSWNSRNAQLYYYYSSSSMMMTMMVVELCIIISTLSARVCMLTIDIDITIDVVLFFSSDYVFHMRNCWCCWCDQYVCSIDTLMGTFFFFFLQH